MTDNLDGFEVLKPHLETFQELCKEHKLCFSALLDDGERYLRISIPNNPNHGPGYYLFAAFLEAHCDIDLFINRLVDERKTGKSNFNSPLIDFMAFNEPTTAQNMIDFGQRKFDA